MKLIKKLLTCSHLYFFILSYIPYLCFSQNILDNLTKAETYFKEKNYGKAIEAYYVVLKNDPNNQTATYNLAACFFEEKKYEEAVSVYKQLLRISPIDNKVAFQTQYNMGVVMAKEKKWEEAARFFKQSVLSNYTDNQARDNLQLALNEMNNKKGLKPKIQTPKNDDNNDSGNVKKELLNQQMKDLTNEEMKLRQQIQQIRSKPSKPEKDW